MKAAPLCPLFPMQREDPLDPPPAYAALRAACPVSEAQLWNGQSTWLATRYDQVREILGDSGRFSTVAKREGYPMLAPGRAEFLLKERPTFQRMDPPEHGPFRRMLTRDFAVRRIELMRPRVTEVVDDLITALERKGPPADIVSDLALPLPTIIISEMLGVPYEDHDFIQDRGAAKLRLDGDPKAPAAAQQEIIDYFDQLLRKMEADPSASDDSILGRLVRDEILPGRLDHDDAVAIAELLVVAGHETTANMVALGTLLLLRHPEQLEKLRASPQLMGNAVEEMLRFLTITHYNGARVATQDTTLGDVQIREGEGAWALLAAANRDPEAFPDPDRFDIERNDAGHHVTFGFGVHQCLGQGLARMELAIIFERLLHRFPGLRLAVPFDQIRFKHDSFIYGVWELPVEWG